MAQRETTSVRFDPGQAEEVAAVAEAMRVKLGVQVTPAQVLRAALAKGLEVMRVELGIAKPKRSK